MVSPYLSGAGNFLFDLKWNHSECVETGRITPATVTLTKWQPEGHISVVLTFFSRNLRCSCWACQFNILYCFQSYLTDVDECSSNPCINGGVCVNEVNKYRCTCPPGFTGAQCEISKFNYFMLHLLHWLCCTMCKTNPTLFFTFDKRKVKSSSFNQHGG